MNKEMHLKRIEDLKEEAKKNQEVLAKAQANLIAIDGAIQQCEWTISELEKEEKPSA